MEDDVLDVDAHVAEGLVAERALLAHPLPAGDDRVLDLVQVLHATCHIDDDEVGARAVRTEAPDLLRGRLVPAELVDEVRPRALGPSRGDLALSMASARGLRVVLRSHVAWTYRRLCLFGDLDMTVRDEVP